MGELDLSEIKKRLERLEARLNRLEGQRSVRVGITVEELKEKMNTLPQRSPEFIEWALAIAGSGEGPEDLARNFRAYLRGDKR